MHEQANPVLARRRLAVRLHALRNTNGRSLDDLAGQLGVSKAQASRLDTGARGFSPEFVRQLAAWYRLERSEADHLLEMAHESRKRVWYQQIDLHDSYRTFIGLEQAAAAIDEFAGSAIPGLAQTRRYATAATAGSSLAPAPAEVEQAVDVRLRRQTVLSRTQPPSLWFVIDEAVLARVTGGRSVMDEQLDHLLDLAAEPNITVQVVGFEQGTYLGSQYAQFIRLAFDGLIPDVVYTDGQFYPVDTTDAPVVRTYYRVWDMLRAFALDPETSRQLIGNYRSSH